MLYVVNPITKKLIMAGEDELVKAFVVEGPMQKICTKEEAEEIING